VARRGAGTDNHTVGDARFALDVQRNNILTFQIVDLIDDEILECFTLQVYPPGNSNVDDDTGWRIASLTSRPGL
jgi:hypothetical protein